MSFTRKRGLFESSRVLYIASDQIAPNPSQPRVHFSQEGLEELAASITEHGILQPLSVRRKNGGYELISGERRLRAAKLAGLKQVPCILVQAGQLESSLLALIENLQRRDLDYVEEATALQRLIVNYHLSQEDAAKRVGKSQSAVANKLRLLRLSPEMLDKLRSANLTERHARALLRLPEEARAPALDAMIENGWNVAQTEQYIETLLHPPQPEEQPPEKTVRRKKPMIYIRDIRLFLNTLTRSLDTMQRSGLDATCSKEEDEAYLTLTIQIPKQKNGKPAGSCTSTSSE